MTRPPLDLPPEKRMMIKEREIINLVSAMDELHPDSLLRIELEGLYKKMCKKLGWN